VRFPVAFAAAFVSGAAVAVAILPLGLQYSWAVPTALLLGALASGLGAWLANGGSGRLPLVLASSLASLALAVPLVIALFATIGVNLLTSASIVLAVVAAASAFAMQRSRRLGVRVKFVSVVAALVVLLLLLPVADVGYTWLTACEGEERAVFEEFPQYSPRAPEELDPKPDNIDALSAFGDACVVRYGTSDTATQVIDYFEGRLKENGWEVRPSNSAAVFARRGSYEYRVSFTGDPTMTQGGTRLTVVVWEP
jgi:hypothetical protein